MTCYKFQRQQYEKTTQKIQPAQTDPAAAAKDHCRQLVCRRQLADKTLCTLATEQRTAEEQEYAA